jgi:hypothetical protein
MLKPSFMSGYRGGRKEETLSGYLQIRVNDNRERELCRIKLWQKTSQGG